jgi:tetratricopeptide (TPR) repeat protein
MTRIFWVSCCLFFLCASCTGSYRPGSQTQPPAPEGVALRGENQEPADTACSYSYFLRGKTAEAAGRPEEARDAYEKALACDRQAVHVMRSLAILLVRLELKEEAAAWLEKLRFLQPAEVETFTFLANLYAVMGSHGKAIELYKEILRHEPGNFHAALLLGTIYARNRQDDLAKEVLAGLVEAGNQSYLGHLHLAKLHLELHEFDLALSHYHAALALNWSEGLAFELADLYELLGRNPEALEIYGQILARDEASEQARSRLVGAYLQLGDLDRALAELQELRQYATDLQKVDFTIGRLFLQQERYQEAAEKFSRLLADDSELHTVRYLLGFIHYEKGDFKEAMTLALSVPAQADTYVDATMLLIRIMEEEQDFVGVESILLERIAGEGIGNPIFYMALGGFYQEQEQTEAAMEIYETAMGHYPDDAGLVFQYGMYLERQDRSAEAMEQMQSLLLLDPDNPYALNYVGYTWADQGVNLEKALTYILQAVASRPRDGFIRDSLGWVYFRLGRIAEAVRELEKAIALEPADPHIHEHLGDVYVEKKELRQAVEAYQRAMELFHDQEEKQEAVRRKLEALLP